MATRTQVTQRTAFRVLEDRIEELESENESLREEKDYYEGVTKQFRDTLSGVEFDDDVDLDDIDLDDIDLDDEDEDEV